LLLLSPLFLKYISDEVRFVLIPIVFLFLFDTYTLVGILNSFPVGEVDIEIGLGKVNTTYSLCTNG